jgi:hypothetical protein
MGSSGNVNDYQISIWDPTKDYPIDDASVYPSDPGNWLSDLDGRDPRVDDNTPLLLQDNTTLELNGGGTMSGTQPFGDAPTFESNEGGDTRLRVEATGTDSRIYLNPGTYRLSGGIIGTGLSGLNLSGGTGVDVTGMQSTTNAGATRIFFYADADIIVLDSAKTNGTNYIEFDLTATTVTSSVLNISPGVDTIQPSDFGDTSAYQLGQMAAWFQFTAPDAYVNGKIFSVLAPQNADAHYLKADAPPYPGSLLYGRNIARMEGRYQGPVKKGTYVWYQHADVKQRDFHKPSEHSQIDFPEIIIAGNASLANDTGSEVGYTGEIGQLTVAMNFYRNTANNAWRSAYPQMPEAIYEQALLYCQQLPHAVENDSHYNMFKKVMSDFGKGIEWAGQHFKSGVNSFMNDIVRPNMDLFALAI